MVEVYWNLHRQMWSIREVGGRVIFHALFVEMRHIKFVVHEGSRQTVLRQRQKFIHAFVRGILVGASALENRRRMAANNRQPGYWRGMWRVTYNPYYAGYFYIPDMNNAPIYAAPSVLMGARMVEGERRALVLMRYPGDGEEE